MEQNENRQFRKVIPVLRGVLAQATGNEDMPYRPVTLNIAGEKSEEALQIDSLGPSDSNEEIRDKLKLAFDDYLKKHDSRPTVVSIKNVGRVSVVEPADESGLPLENKVALVTGAAGAIGYGICRVLLENGCLLAASDLPGERLDDFVADLAQGAPGRVVGVGIDVTEQSCVEEGFERVVQTWGGIDIVVINAGIALVSRLEEMDLDAFRRLEKVNVEGTLLTLRESAHYFAAQGIGGDIVVMSTKNVPCPGAGFGAYSVTKAACHQLGRIASLELAQYGVRVNMVAPDAVFSQGKYKSGLWETVGPDRMKVRGLDEKGLHEYYRSRNLLKAKVTGRHVANAVLFFVTHQTPTTGATIPVDGGLPDATPR